MNTKFLMTASSIVMGILGLAAIFLPKEILINLGQPQTELLTLFVQMTGALYFGFAIMNWMAKTVLIGGIYARPLCIGNFSHFVIAGLALLKATSINRSLPFGILTIVYLLFAILFGIVLFTNPKFKKVTA